MSLTSEQKSIIVKAAIAAPSADNSQPFQYRWLTDNTISLYIDKSRSGKTSDNRFVLSDIALGAVIENIVIQASSLSVNTEIDYFPDESNDYYVANIVFSPSDKSKDEKLASAIENRCTDRRFPFSGEIDEELQGKLELAAQCRNASISWFLDKNSKKLVLPIIQQAESVRFKSKKLHQELFSTVTFDNPHIDEGMHISVLAIEKPAQPIFKQLKKWSVMKWLNKIGGASMLGFRSVKIPILFSPALALISVENNSRLAVIDAGRAIQRVWLEATNLGLSIQPYAAPGVFSLGFLDCESDFYGDVSMITKKMKGITKDKQGIMFLRLGYISKPLLAKTNRREANTFSIDQ